MKIKTLKTIKQATEDLLEALGADKQNENFKSTPDRVERAYQEMLAGDGADEKTVADILSSTFPTDYDQMVSVLGIEAWGLCPHHLLGIQYDIAIGYLPAGKVLGISKLPRLAILLAKSLTLQEQLTNDLVVALENSTKARGVISVVTGSHLCMRARGVKSGARVVTSSVRGLFQTDPAAKSEFLNFWSSFRGDRVNF